MINIFNIKKIDIDYSFLWCHVMPWFEDKAQWRVTAKGEEILLTRCCAWSPEISYKVNHTEGMSAAVGAQRVAVHYFESTLIEE